MFFSKQAIGFLNAALNLNATGFEQDWDLELADADRVDEFIDFFQANRDLDEQVKGALLALIIASLDDCIEKESEKKYFEKLVPLLGADIELFSQVSEEWVAANDAYPTGDFAVSQLLRQINANLQETRKTNR